MKLGDVIILKDFGAVIPYINTVFRYNSREIKLLDNYTQRIKYFCINRTPLIFDGSFGFGDVLFFDCKAVDDDEKIIIASEMVEEPLLSKLKIL
jgi:hypothetical protein